MKKGILLVLVLAGLFGCTETIPGDPLVDGTVTVGLEVHAVAPTAVPTRGGVELTILGENFGPGVTVFLDGARVEGVVRHDERRLTAVAPRLGVGAKSLEVRDGGQHVALAGALRYYVEDVRFGAGEALLDGVVPFSFAAGDFDGDQRDDVVLTRVGTHPIEIWTSRNDGRRLVDPQPLGGPTYANFMRTLDADGDGLDDVVTGDGVLYLARPGGSFLPGIDILGERGWVRSVHRGDLDGDGRDELALFFKPSLEPVWTLHVVEVDEGGGVTLELERPDVVQSDSGSASLDDGVVADLDGDGIADLVYTGDDGRLHRLRGPDLDTATRWSSAVTAGALPYRGLLVLHLDSDADLDVVWLTHDSAYVFLGDGAGSFEPALDVGRVCPSSSVVPLRGPVDAPPLVLCGPRVLRGWLFGDQLLWYDALPFDVSGAATANLDGDAASDLVVRTSFGLTAAFGDGSGGFDAGWGRMLETAAPLDPAGASSFPDRLVAPPLAEGAFAGGVRLAAAWGTTLAFADPAAEVLSWKRTHTLEPVRAFGSGLQASHLAACDLDGDGFDDLGVLATTLLSSEHRLQIVYTRADGVELGETLPVRTNGDAVVYPRAQRLLAGDVDGDGLCDLVWAHEPWPSDCIRSCRPQAVAYLNRPEGFAIETLSLSRPSRLVHPIRGADLDRDGDLDLYQVKLDPSVDFHHRTLFIWKNEGGLAFEAISIDLELASPEWSSPLRATDLELEAGASGGYDFITPAEPLDHSLVAGFLARGSIRGEGVAAVEITQLPMRGTGLRRGEVNGDGLQDLLVVGSELQILVGTPENTLRIAAVVPAGAAPQEALLTDVDGDGLDDILRTDERHPGKVLLLHNDSE